MLNQELKDLAWQVVCEAKTKQDFLDAQIAADIILLIEEVESLRTALRKTQPKKETHLHPITELGQAS